MTPETKSPLLEPSHALRSMVAIMVAACLNMQAGIFDTNLLANSDAEAGPTSPDGYQVVPVPGWVTNGPVTVVAWGTSGFPSPSSPGPTNRGSAFFAGGWDAGISSAEQVIDLTEGAAAVDASAAECLLSGYLGGYASDGDHATLTAEFRNASLGVLGSVAIGPVTPEDRNYQTGLLFRQATAAVPPGTRSLRVVLGMQRTGGGLYNDGYADNLSLTLSAQPFLRWLNTAGQWQLAWPTNSAGFVLETSAVLGGGAHWTNWPATPVVVGNEFQVPVDLTEAQRHFRLHQ
jgi:hypothetical protein